MNTRCLCIAAVLWLSVLSAISPEVNADEVYIGLRQEALFSRLGLDVERVEFAFQQARVPTLVYWFRNEGDYLAVAVHTSVQAARLAHKYSKLLPTVAPPPPPEGEPIGEEMVWGYWREGPSSPGARIEFRRRNVFVVLRKLGEPSEVVELARRIDGLIRDDRQIAPLGRFDPPPEITSAGIPETLTLRPMREYTSDGAPMVRRNPPRQACVRIDPQFRGLGPRENIRFVVSGKELVGNQIGPDGKSARSVRVPVDSDRIRSLPASAENDGRFILRVRIPQERRTDRLTLIAVNEDNVIVAGELQVTIVPAE